MAEKREINKTEKSSASASGRAGKLRRFLGSFRLRLFLTILITGSVSIAAMYITARYVCSNTLIDKRVDMAYDHLNKMCVKIVDNMYIGNPQNAPQISSELSVAASLFDGRIIVADGGLKIVYDSFSAEEGKTMVSKPSEEARAVTSVSKKSTRSSLCRS